MDDYQTARQRYKDMSIITQQSNVPDIAPLNYPIWPSSLPGPFRVEPPPGMKSINAVRSEQLVVLDYDQVTGKPAAI